MASKHFTLCVDTMSQPCRALIVFAKLNKMNYTAKNVLIHKMQHKSEEFLKVWGLKLTLGPDQGARLSLVSVFVPALVTSFYLW